MAERPGHALPINYAKLNALYDQFVPQKELSREQVYWFLAVEIASQSSTPAKHVAPFVHTRPVKSDVHKKEALFDEFECFRANGNELIQDYFVRFHKLVNDMKVTQLDIPTHQLNTKLPTTFLRIGFPPTNNQLRTSSNPKIHATVHDGQIVTETVQRRASGNTRTKGIQTTGSGVNNSGKKAICYNCHAKAEAFLADVECTAPYDQPLALTTTNLFEANHKDAYGSDVDEGPYASTAFMANLSSTGGIKGSSSSHINEVQINDDSFFGDVSYPLAQEMQQEEHLNSEVDSVLDDNMITYDEYQNDSRVETVPTVVSADEA
nr:hypothetical protein [Tanacetum cinerariifolium]